VLIYLDWLSFVKTRDTCLN